MSWSVEDSRNLQLIKESLEKLVANMDDFFFAAIKHLKKAETHGDTEDTEEKEGDAQARYNSDAPWGRCPRCREPLARNPNIRQGDDYQLECRCGFKTFELETRHGDTEDTEKKE